MLWPAGIAVILCAGALVAMRAPRRAPSAPGAAPRRSLPPVGRHGAPNSARGHDDLAIGRDITRFLLVVAAGTAVLYLLMVALGVIVIHAGPAIDKPIFHWTVTHRIHAWHSFMVRATELGDKYPVWAAAATAAVCLAVSWRRYKWLPPVALGTLIVVDHFLTLAINHTVTRTPPPGAGGIFPSGGTDRAIDYYGLIAYLLWREFSGQRRTAILAGAVVAAMGFSEGYSRVYLDVHWFTDVLSGFFYGCLILAVFIAAVRIVAGPADVPTGGRDANSMTLPFPRTGAREVPT
jgi:membrane-associated phospholipid phosphatase